MLKVPRVKFHYYLSILCVAAAFTGLVASRSLLSISMIVLAVNTIISPQIKSHFKYFINTPALWVITLLFFTYLLSGLYSTDLKHWGEEVQIKLPFLILP